MAALSCLAVLFISIDDIFVADALWEVPRVVVASCDTNAHAIPSPASSGVKVILKVTENVGGRLLYFIIFKNVLHWRSQTINFMDVIEFFSICFRLLHSFFAVWSFLYQCTVLYIMTDEYLHHRALFESHILAWHISFISLWCSFSQTAEICQGNDDFALFLEFFLSDWCWAWQSMLSGFGHHSSVACSVKLTLACIGSTEGHFSIM